MDVDILVTRNLNLFLRDLLDAVLQRIVAPVAVAASPNVTAPSSRPPIDFGAFLDAQGHYVGFCSGCEKWLV
jgi:hypothetical protein